MQRTLDSLYLPSEERLPLPAIYIPICMLLAISPFLAPQSRSLPIIAGAILLILCLRLPNYTFGDVSSDYYNSGPLLALLPWYIDFVLCTPWAGDEAPTYHGSNGAESLHSLTTLTQRLRWAFRLMLPAQRGIGWNWQVKGVPKDPFAKMSPLKSAIMHFAWAVCYYLQSAIMLVIIGWSSAYEKQSDGLLRILAIAVTSWAGAAWVWDRLCCAYGIAAAFTIAIRFCDPWEWPPLMGSLSNAWSVRQMWSVTYHQSLRRLLSQPALRLTRLLHVPKGSRLSGNSQLIITFAISCFFHQLQMYMACRRTTGELTFFMSQVLAIMLESEVQTFTKWMFPNASRTLCRRLGYVWVLVWFSFSLHPYVDGLLETEIAEDWFFAKQPLQLGSSFVR